MDDGLEATTCVGVLEDNPPQRRPVEIAPGGQDARAELLHHRGEAGRPRSHDLTREHVGVDDHRTQLAQPAADARLAGRDTTCQADTDHDVTAARSGRRLCTPRGYAT